VAPSSFLPVDGRAVRGGGHRGAALVLGGDDVTAPVDLHPGDDAVAAAQPGSSNPADHEGEALSGGLDCLLEGCPFGGLLAEGEAALQAVGKAASGEAAAAGAVKVSSRADIEQSARMFTKIAEAVAFNHWLREDGLRRLPGAWLLDTTRLTVAEASPAVARWAAARLAAPASS
jgi:hypothetical protein